MSESDLKVLLEQVHKKLNEPPSLDAATERMLGIVAQDIAVVLGRQAKSAEKDDESGVGSHTLKKMAVEFEAEHPRLAHTLNDVADSLAKIGI